MIINEDFFKGRTANKPEIIKTRTELEVDLPFHVEVLVINIDRKYRNEYSLNLLFKKLNRMLCSLFDNSDLIENYKIWYQLTAQREYFYREDVIENAEYVNKFDVTFYNNPKVFNPSLLKEMGWFRICLDVEFAKQKSLYFEFFKLFNNKILSCLSKTFNTSSISQVAITNKETNAQQSLAKLKFVDIENRKNNNATLMTLKNLYKFLYNDNDYSKIKNYLSDSQYDSDVLEFLKRTFLSVNDVDIDMSKPNICNIRVHSDATMGVTIREHTKYNNGIRQYIDRFTKRHIQLHIFCGGTLKLTIWTTPEHDIQSDLSIFDDYLPNLHLTSYNWKSYFKEPAFKKTLDLSRFEIDNIKYIEEGDVHIDLITNPNHKPQIKCVDKLKK